ncbi:membrane anchor subunit of succinate dehydrogenase, Sdh4 [Phlyctochytrium bullatum]|nr:membrane anchor subunit of succinate dehydrogenase, Sdh4 [Phlyctochytrium bullatum]
MASIAVIRTQCMGRLHGTAPVSRQLLRIGLNASTFKTFHSTTRSRSGATATVAESEKGKLHGSYHWNAERALSVASVPLMATAFIAGPLPLVDLGLGVVLPLHCHIGFDAIVQDYVPHRKYGALNTALTWTLRLSTALVLYGCYQFNTNDVGITAFVKRLWTGKL